MMEMKLLHIMAGLNGLLKKAYDLGMPLLLAGRCSRYQTLN
jgi:hypothetical protein